MLARDLAHLRLGHAAQRKLRTRQLLLGEAKEKIRLVLGQVGRALENPAAAAWVVFVDGVMTGGDAIGADRSGGLQQLVELEMVVAKRAGNRRSPGQVLAHKRTHHILLEPILLVDDVIRNAQLLGHVARVVDVIKRTAAPSLGLLGNAVLACETRLIPQLQREADDTVSPEWASIGRSRRGVDPSGHGYGDDCILSHGK